MKTQKLNQYKQGKENIKTLTILNDLTNKIEDLANWAKQNPGKSGSIALFIMTFVFFMIWQSAGKEQENEEDLQSYYFPIESDILDPDGQSVLPVEPKFAEYSSELGTSFYKQDKESITRAFSNNLLDFSAFLTFLETYLPKFVEGKNGRRGAIGLGSTYYHMLIDENKYFLIPLLNNASTKDIYTTLIKHIENMSLDEALDQVYLSMNWYQGPLTIISDSFPTGYKMKGYELIALTCLGYQLPDDLKEVLKKLKTAKTEQEIADAFMVYSGSDEYEAGSIKRRWWIAMYYLGKIQASDVLQMKADAYATVIPGRKTKDLIDVIITSDNHFIINDKRLSDFIKSAQQANLKTKTKDINGNSPTIAEFLYSSDSTRALLEHQFGDKNLLINEFVVNTNDDSLYDKQIRLNIMKTNQQENIQDKIANRHYGWYNTINLDEIKQIPNNQQPINIAQFKQYKLVDSSR